MRNATRNTGFEKGFAAFSLLTGFTGGCAGAFTGARGGYDLSKNDDIFVKTVFVGVGLIGGGALGAGICVVVPAAAMIFIPLGGIIYVCEKIGQEDEIGC